MEWEGEEGVEDGGDDCVGARSSGTERRPAAAGLVWTLDSAARLCLCFSPGEARRIRWPFRPLF